MDKDIVKDQKQTGRGGSKQTNAPLSGEAPWGMDIDEIVAALKTDSEHGLNSDEAVARIEKYGPNRLARKQGRSTMRILVDQFKNLIVLLLVSAAAVSFLFGQWLEGVSIMVAMLINVVIGFFTELKAHRSMEALKEMTKVSAKVVRDADVDEIASAKLVPGDLVVLEGGDLVPADVRLIEANRMQADESALTGESVPVDKSIQPVDAETNLAERSNMLFKGTAVTSGSGRGVVTATGMSTQIGRISELVEETEELTPLEERLHSLGQRLIWITLGIAALVGGVGAFSGQDVLLIFETAVALAVAAIPEGLPIVATIALARGMWRMAKKNALVNRLSAVETLGATSVICTDKTGTLTENRMTVDTLVLAGRDGPEEISLLDENGDLQENAEGREEYSEQMKEIVSLGMLCSNAHLDPEQEEEIGDPLEIALLKVGGRMGLHRDKLLEERPEEKEEAFSAETNMMATWHKVEDGYLVAVKGAPEAVLASCTAQATVDGEKQWSDQDAAAWKEANERLAADGLRLVAVARKKTASLDVDPYESLTLMGLVGLLDPPRKGVAEVIEELKAAGVRVVMVTGDQPMTARHIGQSLGLAGEDDNVVHGDELTDFKELSDQQRQELLKTSIFARISPEQKLDLISLFQADGSVVAMTGDGVNDAPALTRADIGVAMGKRGTQVAREASDIVLKDDAFSTIALAVEQGRIIFNNIRKFIVYLLSGNVGAILIVGLAMLFGTTLPLLPLQILYLNMISDVFPALALGVGTGEHSVMLQPPRDPGEPVVTRGHWGLIVAYGVLIASTVLGAFWIALSPLQLEPGRAVTISFLTLAFSRTWHVFNMRDFRSNPFVNDVTRNPFVWGAVVLSIGLLLLAVYVRPLAEILDLYRLTSRQWGLVLGMSLVPFVLVQLFKQFSHWDPSRPEKDEEERGG